MGEHPLRVLMITSEAVPYAKTGGLADVVSALSKELHRLGHDVRIVMPRYYSISRDHLLKEPQPLGVPMSYGEEWAGIYKDYIPVPGTDGPGVPIYFLDHEELFGRHGIYGPRPDQGYADNTRRFTFLCRGAFQLCRALNWYPQILHGHDWVAGLIPYIHKRWESHGQFADAATVLTIHNLGYQGITALEEVAMIQKDRDWMAVSSLEFNGALNLLKAGIMGADEITTVSPTYAREITTPEFGHGLDGLLSYRGEDLTGILNGMDYHHWDPVHDPFLMPHNYDETSLAGKAKIKAILQKEAGLKVSSKIPLFGMVTRLVEQKGIGELFGPGYGSFHAICQEMDIQFILLGSGEKWCEEELKSLEAKLPNLRVWLGYDERLSHLIEAGADFFLMPSRYEPCGLNQMYSLRYGTLPIVRSTGGLADTVENYDQNYGTGTGFMFHDLNPTVLYNVMGWVTWAWYNNRSHIRKMRIRGMEQRFTWQHSAVAYLDVYRRAQIKTGKGVKDEERTLHNSGRRKGNAAVPADQGEGKTGGALRGKIPSSRHTDLKLY